MKFQIEVTAEDPQGKKIRMPFQIDATCERQLAEKFNILRKLDNRLKHEDLAAVTELIKDKPALLPAIMEIIEDAKDKSDASLVISAPGYITKIIGIIKS